MKVKTCLVGGCPSSGSTYLADLLDSAPQSICGPEIGLFAIKEFYDEDFQKINVNSQSITASPHSSGVHLYKKSLPHYGIKKDEIIKMIINSKNHTEFFEKFICKFSKFRNKNDLKVFYEKTPQNAFIFNKFLDNVVNSSFIFITRNPIDNITSLQRRGYSFRAAATTWLVFMAAFKKSLTSNSVFYIKYEDLLKNPYGSVANIVENFINHSINLDELEFNYKNNSYRDSAVMRIKSWTKGKDKKKIIKEDKIFCKESFIHISKLHLSKEYAEIFNLPSISFKEAIEISGYKKYFEEKLFDDSFNKKSNKTPGFSLQMSELKLVVGKHLRTSSVFKNFFRPHKFINALRD